MRNIALFSLLFLLFSGCAYKNAFDYFGMDDAHERAVEQLRTASLTHNSRAKVVINAIYLNRAFPKQYAADDYETFMVALLLEDVTLNLETSNLLMNHSEPSYIDVMEEGDELRDYMPLNNPWTAYYKVGFPSVGENNDTLELTFESGRFGTAVLTFQKDE
jgi:hypothetical protein